MAKSRRRSIYPILLIALVNGLVIAGAVVPLAYYGFEAGPPVDLAAAGWAGWTSLALAAAGLVILIVGGVLLRAIPKIPALTMGVYPASVAAVGLIGAQLGAGLTVDAVAASDPSQAGRLVGLGMSEALNASVIATYVAAALMMGGALTIALRHWPSRSSLSSGGKLGLMGGGFILVGMIVGSLFWQPLGGLGILPWITALLGLIAIALAAHAIRNDPTDEANVQAAGELWVTLLLSLGALVFVCTARHTGILMEGLAIFRSVEGSQPDPKTMIEAWTAAEPALYASALYSIPLLFSSIASMLSRESLGSWGLRNAAASIFVVPIFFVAPSALAYVQTAWAANQVAKRMSCAPPVVSNADVTIALTSAPLQPNCAVHSLDVGRTNIMFGGTKIGTVQDLDTEAGCKKIASQLGAADACDGVVVDESTSYRRAACLAAALAEPFGGKSAMFKQLHPDVVGREGAVIPWIVKGAGGTVSKARAPFNAMGTQLFAVSAFGPVAEGWDPKLMRLHVFEGGWELQRAPKASKMRFDGTPKDGIERLSKALGTNLESHVVAVTADGSVRMGVVLQYVAQFKYPQLVLPEGFGKVEGEAPDAGAVDSADPSASALPPGSAAPPGSALGPAGPDGSASGPAGATSAAPAASP